ncbi:hypothetical protein, partial [Caulobacter sp.]|uniref:hypothetical protein n=1 Tax=Caulobacter sp. TaxID=78 RepID=UPI003BB171EA
MDSSDLLKTILEAPISGLAVACGTGFIFLAGYWLYRDNDGKRVNRTTKITTLTLLIGSIVSFSTFWINSSHDPANKLVNAKPEFSISKLGISETDWNCLNGNSLWKKYNLEDYRAEIALSAEINPDFQYLL